MPASSEPIPLPGRAQPAGQQESLLVVQLARLGDFLQSTPLLACLRQAHPQARLVAAVSPAQAPLARACRYVDRLVILDPAALAGLAQAGPDPASRAVLRSLLEPLWQIEPQAVYNLNHHPLSACLAASWPQARLRGWRLAGSTGLAGESWSSFVLAMVADRRLTRLHLCDIMASYADPPQPALESLDYRLDRREQQAAQGLAPDGRGPLVALQPGANNDLRRWPLESFAQLARGLLDQGARLALVGAAQEGPLARRLHQALGRPAGGVSDLMGRTSLGQLAGLLSQCDLVVSGDTGTLHLATALGAKVLALFMGPAQVHETGPYGPGHLVLQARGDCGPCWEHAPACQGQAPCRRLLAPQLVLRAALALLRGEKAEQIGARLDLAPGTEALLGVMDSFGQSYRPLQERPLTAADALALALRQAGRLLLRSSYQAPLEQLVSDWARDFSAPDDQEAKGLEGLGRAARALAQAAAQSDAPAASRAVQQAPGLRPLAGQIGVSPTQALIRSVEAATEILALASSI